MKPIPENRNIPIDTLRGLACILLVAYHVIGNTPKVGLRLQEGILKDANELLSYIRMPLFTFLSGIVYDWRPFKSDWIKFLNGKIRRLLIPMLFVGTIFALSQTFIPGTNSSIKDWRFLRLIPVAHYWFIESLFFIFLLIIPLEYFSILHTKAGFFTTFFLASILYVSNVGTPWFSLAGVVYLFPFFLVGIYCTRFPLQLQHKKIIGSLLMLIIILFLIFYGLQYAGERRSINALVIGNLSCLALLFIQAESEILARIGFYSYSVYLFGSLNNLVE